jgi:Nuclease A inhibitor-like protein
MKTETEQLLATLEVITEKLYLMSESDERITPFVWDVNILGAFSLSKMLSERGLLHMINTDKLIREWSGEELTYSDSPKATDAFKKMITICQDNLTEIKAYEFKNYQDYPGDSKAKDGFDGHDRFQFFTGKMQNNKWIGLIPIHSKPSTCNYGDKFLQTASITSQIFNHLNQQIDAILDKVTPFIINYESEKSRGVARAEAETEEEVIEKLFELAYVTETWKFKSFDREYESEDYNLAEMEKFISIYLKYPKLYVVGNWAIFRFYVAGKISNGDWLGVSTATTWT